MTYFSNRVKAIPPSGIRSFFDLVMSSKGIISLGVGEPDFFTPWAVRDEAIYRIEKGYTTYTSNKGLEELRIELSKYLRSKFDLDYTKNEFLITNGVSEAVDIIMRAFINPGDEVILPEPSYVCYKPLIELCDGVVVPVDTKVSDYIVKAEEIEKKITTKTKAIIICYPNNPTGTSIAYEELEKIADLAKKHDLLIFSDEIYAELSFGSFRSIGTIPGIKERLIYLNGFSKAHSMTGWRVGYIAAPEYIIEEVNKIHQYSALCAPIISQYAALEACKSTVTEVEKMRLSYLRRAKYFSEKMTSIGLKTAMPHGGLYCFSCIESLGLSSMAFAQQLLSEAKVAIVPGNVFGSCGEGYVRSCIATDFDDLKVAVERISEFVQKIRNG
ncbi:MAG: aminotransferase class I/II-fold pyridoxal phosphate-dependent enzyme [Candidatus Margulisiibacteriota bacterium]|nr:aminotransferase class I/II-fold pyridoxal phosphate-dependent enzyme [Candidatus Margulisiibacteriota bacterium]